MKCVEMYFSLVQFAPVMYFNEMPHVLKCNEIYRICNEMCLHVFQFNPNCTPNVM